MCSGMPGKYYFSGAECLIILECNLKDKKKESVDYETGKEMVRLPLDCVFDLFGVGFF